MFWRHFSFQHIYEIHSAKWDAEFWYSQKHPEGRGSLVIRGGGGYKPFRGHYLTGWVDGVLGEWMLEDINKLKVQSTKKSQKHQCQAQHDTRFIRTEDIFRIPYKYTKQVFVSPSNHQRTVVVDKEYPRVSYTKKSINSNPFIDPSDSLGQNTPLVEGYPGFLSPQLGRKTYPGQSCTLPGGGQDKGRTRRLTEEYCNACDEATQTPTRNKKKCNIM